MCRSLHGVTEASFTVRIVSSIARVGADAWDALVGDDDPFVEHAFLCALEESGSVGAGTGWHPAHLLIEEGDRLVAAVPLYVWIVGYLALMFGVEVTGDQLVGSNIRSVLLLFAGLAGGVWPLVRGK